MTDMLIRDVPDDVIAALASVTGQSAQWLNASLSMRQ